MSTKMRMMPSTSSEQRSVQLECIWSKGLIIVPQAFNLEVPKGRDDKILSPLEKNLSPLAEGMVKRTTTFANLVTKALNTNPTGEAPYVRARREADAADQEYRTAVRKLDRQRLGLEERVEDTLKNLQKWELDRLRAVKTGRLYFNGRDAAADGRHFSQCSHSTTLVWSACPEA